MGTEKLLKNLKKNGNSDRIEKLPIDYKKPGKYSIKVLPSKRGIDENPAEMIFFHFNFTHPNFSKAGTFICLGRNCPLCKEAKRQLAEEEEANIPKSQRTSWRLKASPNFLYYVEFEENLYYISLDYNANKALNGAIAALATSGINAMDFENGRELCLTLDILEDGKKKWECFSVPNKSTVSEKIQDLWKAAPELQTLYDRRRLSSSDLNKVVKGEKIEWKRDESKNQSSKPAQKESAPVMRSETDVKDEKEEKSVTEEKAPETKNESDSPKKEESLEERKQRIKAQLNKK